MEKTKQKSFVISQSNLLCQKSVVLTGKRNILINPVVCREQQKLSQENNLKSNFCHTKKYKSQEKFYQK